MTTAAGQLREVSCEVFYRSIGPLNVSLEVVGPFPYATVYREASGRVVGRAVDSMERGDDGLLVARYYLTPA